VRRLASGPATAGRFNVPWDLRGAGGETYAAFSGSSAIHQESRAVLVRTSLSPIRYERRLADGSVEVQRQLQLARLVEARRAERCAGSHDGSDGRERAEFGRVMRKSHRFTWPG